MRLSMRLRAVSQFSKQNAISPLLVVPPPRCPCLASPLRFGRSKLPNQRQSAKLHQHLERRDCGITSVSAAAATSPGGPSRGLWSVVKPPDRSRYRPARQSA